MPKRTSKKPKNQHNEAIPPSLNLRQMIQGHKDKIAHIAWSPDGKIIASASDTIRLWDIETGQLVNQFWEYPRNLAWSPNGKLFAVGNYDNTIDILGTETWQPLRKLPTIGDSSIGISSLVWSPDAPLLASGNNGFYSQIWDAETGQMLQAFDALGRKEITDRIARYFASKGQSPTSSGYSGPFLTWSLDGQKIASGHFNGTVCLWDALTGQLLWEFKWETKRRNSVTLLSSEMWQTDCRCIARSPNGQLLVAGFADGTIVLLDAPTGYQVGTLEGHTNAVIGLSFSLDGRILASKSSNETVVLWNAVAWEPLESFPESSSDRDTGLAFHPTEPILATLGEEDKVIRIWDLAMLLGSSAASSPGSVFGKASKRQKAQVRYTNAKVVLVGDSGVGKSGLGLVLSKEPFVPTESTHGRRVWVFENREVKLPNGRKETQETLLWDLAGQPSYRLIHQLHLNEVTVALVVFDARSEIDPFAGVHHWDRALRIAQRSQGKTLLPMKKFLVAARIDRGGIGVSRARIDSRVHELGFDGYFETSAKVGRGIEELRMAIQEAISWESLPWVSSTDLFQRIKNFLVAEKEAGRLLSTSDDLYRTFMRFEKTSAETGKLQAQFETCIGRVESRGLIRRLSFGKLVLLQPELLDAYASALANAVKDEPDGLGSISEERVQMGNFAIPEDERLEDKEQEKLLLIAMVEDLLRYEIALRDQADDGAYLIFPSQSTRENPDLPDAEGKTVIFNFEGPVLNIYATLVVRLSHSGLFKKKELWKNAVTYTARVGGTCGIFLQNIDEGKGKLTLFFDKGASEETRFHFEGYVETHLQRRALPESVKRRRLFDCKECGFIVTEQLVQLRIARGFNWLACPVCSERVLLLDREERLTTVTSSVVREIDRAADYQRNHEANQTTLQGKIEIGDFDVFLCHNGVDKPAVKAIGEQLKDHGILPWLDEWELRPGLPWQPLLEEQIGQIKAAAVFVGKNGRGPWQDMELYAFLRKFANRGQKCPVIPVILSDCENVPELPTFLESMTWVDFRIQDPNPMERLVWGITGERRKVR